jgi:hypothetical protein
MPVCAYEPCTCEIPEEGLQFCSPECADLAGAREVFCRCGHVDCVAATSEAV